MDLLFWTKVFAVSEWLVRLVMLPVIVMRKEKPATCLAWLAIVFFEPWLGLVLYLLIGENRLGRRRLARRRRRAALSGIDGTPGADRRISCPEVPAENTGLVQVAERISGWPVVGGNAVSFIADTNSMVDRLLADIESARRHVHLLFYIYRDDEVGQRVAEALIRAKQRGVACRVLVDAVGSWGMFRSLAPRLKQQGVEVLASLPVRLYRLPFARLDLRNHRKLAVIDGQVAYTGSQNIVEPTYGHKKAGVWHDVMARLRGPIVRQLQGIFVEDWFHDSGQLLEDPALFPESRVEGRVPIQVIPTGPDQRVEQFQDLIVTAISLADDRVVITSPYFVPDDRMLQALRLAALRGASVDLVLPRRSDHPVIDAAAAFYCEYLMRFGVKVHLYRDGMLHAKTLTVDDQLAMFGSANYDIRSFNLNFELNLLLHAPEAVAETHALQMGYMARSDRATFDDFPSRTWLGRLKVNLAKLLSPLL